MNAPKNLENRAEKTELRLQVGIGPDGPYPAVVTHAGRSCRVELLVDRMGRRYRRGA